MCGINGIFSYHPAASGADEAELLATREAMRRRGPDGTGSWWSEDRRCALGHRRLAILDLSERAAQPMLSEDGRLAISFNGEIYNYPDLRAELQAAGVRLRSGSDTEVLLHLYAREGADIVHRLRGMYAFAIWDQARRELFLARDPYGIKPLYTANDGWTFRFASQVKALLAGGKVSRDPAFTCSAASPSRLRCIATSGLYRPAIPSLSIPRGRANRVRLPRWPGCSRMGRRRPRPPRNCGSGYVPPR